jgi:ribokinase
MRVPRLPSTGETLLGTGYRVDYGGKGSNQAVGCARLGSSVGFITKIGTDAFAEMALTLFREEGIDVQYVRRTREAPTGVGFILVEEDRGHNSIAIDPGANQRLTVDDVLECNAAFDHAAVVLTQLEISASAAEATLRCGRERGAITMLNPAPVRPLSRAVLEMVDVLTPNATEAKVLAGRSPNDNAQPEQVARELLHKGVKHTVMTLGEQGAMVVSASSMIRIPAIKVRAIDTTGAGDAFNAGLATALASGASLEDGVQFAVVCGGLAVTKEGVIPSLPYRDDILRTYREQDRTIPPWLAGRAEIGEPILGKRGTQ